MAILLASSARLSEAMNKRRFIATVNLKIRFSKEVSNYLKTTAQINNDKPKDILIGLTKGVFFRAFIKDEPGTKYEAIFMYQANKTDEDDQSVDKIIYESLQSYLLEGTFKVIKIAEAAENDLHHFDSRFA